MADAAQKMGGAQKAGGGGGVGEGGGGRGAGGGKVPQKLTSERVDGPNKVQELFVYHQNGPTPKHNELGSEKNEGMSRNGTLAKGQVDENLRSAGSKNLSHTHTSID